MEHSNAVPQILHQRVKHRDFLALSGSLFGNLGSTELQQRLASGFIGCHAGAEVVVDVELEMTVKFGHDAAIASASAEQSSHSYEHST
jgi:hypothetical protein